MNLTFAPVGSANAIALHVIGQAELETWSEAQPARIAGWVRASGFTASLGTLLLVPDEAGGIACPAAP